MSEVIRVIIADDHPLIRKGIQLVLSETSDIRVVGEARNGIEAIAQVEAGQADLLLLDLSMPETSALEVIEALKTGAPALKIIIVSAYDDALIVRSLIHAGIAGYLLKEEAEDALVHAIREVHQGATWFSPTIQATLSETQSLASPKVNTLTEREKDVLHAIARGATNHEIARHFQLTDQTVRNYTSRIYEKLDIDSRAEAIVWVLKNGLPPRSPMPPSPLRPDEGIIGFVR